MINYRATVVESGWRCRRGQLTCCVHNGGRVQQAGRDGRTQQGWSQWLRVETAMLGGAGLTGDGGAGCGGG